MPNSSSPEDHSLPAPWGRWIRDALADVPAEGHAAGDARPAAVLIAIEAGTTPVVHFTERGADLRHHPGQISFPGGSVEPGDVDTAATALREAGEEIGLAPRHAHLIGRLPAHRTVTGFCITPHVAWLDAGAPLAADGIEVARLFSVPLAHVLAPVHYQLRRRRRDGIEMPVYSLDYQGDHIWGATAAILVSLAARIARVREYDFIVHAADDIANSIS